MGKIIMIALTLIISITIIAVKHISVHHHDKADHHDHKRGFRHKHGAWISIDYFAYASKIRHWNPAFKVVLSISLIIMCIVLNNVYVSALILLSMAFLVVEVGGLSLRDYISVLVIPLTFVLISIVAIVVDFAGHPIGRYCISLGFTYIYTTIDMLQNGGYLMMKIFAAISALQFMILTTPSSEIISVIRKTRVPSMLIDLMNLVYRFIFILMDVFARMKNAAESRLGYNGFKSSCYTFGNIASNLLILSLKKANAYYDAMEARCYDGELMFLEEEKKLDIKFVIFAAGYVLYLLLLWVLTK